MVTVIEHQKVARRRKHDRARGTSDSHRPAFKGVRRTPRFFAEGLGTGLISRAIRFRSTDSGGARPHRRRPNDSGGAAVGTSRNPSFYRRSFFHLGRIGSAADASYRGVSRRVSRGFGNAVDALFRVEPSEYPVLAAAIAFAVLANLMLLSLGSDEIILSGVVSEIAMPPQQELVARSNLAPRQDEFSVIGEVAGVDPSQFARLEVTTYTVQPGDTLSEIAIEHDLELDTLISFNQIEDVRRLQAGATFEIPNRDGLLYTVKAGDSVASIASRHGATINAILDANDMRSQALDVGQVIFVPNATLNETELKIILGELFAWPTRGQFTSGFGMRKDPFIGVPRFHNGIDLANGIGTPIRAAASGRVVHVESQIGNYGRFVIVRHPDGFQTLYAHLDRFSVRTGQYVDRGAILGTMGNTGRSTGPHLHFSVIHNGTFVDPLRYLH
ncbi:MAG: peptidoglycan DD-metalloendopeptidase family protein [Alkalispirochaeta sp.]